MQRFINRHLQARRKSRRILGALPCGRKRERDTMSKEGAWADRQEYAQPPLFDCRSPLAWDNTSAWSLSLEAGALTMAFTVSCPQCQLRLNIPDQLSGRKVRCSQCGTVFDVAPSTPAGPPPLPPMAADVFQAPPPRSLTDPNWDRLDDLEREPLESGWNVARTGIHLIWISLSGLIIMVVVGFCGGVLMGVARARDGLEPFQIILNLISLGLQLLFLAGRWTCVAVPQQSRSKGLMIGAAICTTLFYVLAIVAVMAVIGSGAMGRRGNPDVMIGAVRGAAALYLLALGSGLAGEILFLLGLRNIASYFGKRSLERSIGSYLTTMVFLTVGGVSFLVAVSVGMRGDPGALAVLSILALVGLLALLVLALWYLRILGATKDAISRALRQERSIGLEGDW
jgi:predicted Zn finger-like uncharacterized protein